jgi:hypothetical protein
MRVLFQREPFDSFFAEALPLLERHKLEIAHYADIPLDVDTEKYRMTESSGLLRVFTARLNRGPSEPLTLIGYAAFFVGPNPHYRTSLQAVQDVLYLAPEQRQGRLGLDLVRFTERELRREGVQVVYHHVKLAHPALGVLLAKDGYDPIEQLYAKRLDR